MPMLAMAGMCIWSRADDHSSGSDRPQPDVDADSTKGSQQKQTIRRHHYRWDLDDGFPGFIRETRRKRLRLYVDADRNGSFTRNDELIGGARIRAAHRRRNRGQLLNQDQTGSVQALTIEAGRQTSNHHVVLESGVDLQLLHPDGSVVALFAGVQV